MRPGPSSNPGRNPLALRTDAPDHRDNRLDQCIKIDGAPIVIQEVCPDETVGDQIPAPIVIASADGLRLYLRPDQAQLIMVETEPNGLDC